MINGIGMVGGGILALITSYGVGEGETLLVSNWSYCLLLTMLIIIVSNIGLYNLYGYLLRIYTATFLSFAGFLCPLMAALFGWFFLCEPISVSFLFSLSMVTVGLIIFYYEELRQGYIIQQSQ
jgi:drug/metabolite transporter (DMT)-like permease